MGRPSASDDTAAAQRRTARTASSPVAEGARPSLARQTPQKHEYSPQVRARLLAVDTRGPRGTGGRRGRVARGVDELCEEGDAVMDGWDVKDLVSPHSNPTSTQSIHTT